MSDARAAMLDAGLRAGLRSMDARWPGRHAKGAVKGQGALGSGDARGMYCVEGAGSFNCTAQSREEVAGR